MDRLHRNSAKFACAALIGTVAAIVLVVLSLRACQSTTRSDSAITRSEFASKGLGFTLPSSAHEIYFLYHSTGPSDTVFYLRFDIDSAQMDDTISDLLAANDSSYDRKKGYVRQPLSSALITRPRRLLEPVSWWNPSQVTRGYYIGSETSGQIRMVIDEDHSRIYFFQTG